MTRLLFLSLNGGTSGVDRELIEPLLRRCIFRASICLRYQVMAGGSERRLGPVGVPGQKLKETLVYPQLFSAFICYYLGDIVC